MHASAKEKYKICQNITRLFRRVWVYSYKYWKKTWVNYKPRREFWQFSEVVSITNWFNQPNYYLMGDNSYYLKKSFTVLNIKICNSLTDFASFI